MPEARALHPEIETLEPHMLHARYQELLAPFRDTSGRLDTARVSEIPDDILREMVVIMAALRKKSAGPPRANSPRTKDIPTAEDL